MDEASGFVRRAVLGVDAAWTATQPSGVALAVETAGGWRLASVEASYAHFHARAGGVWPGDERPRGSKPSAAALLEAAQKLSGRRVDLVAVDMPLSRQQINGRRCCDQEISRRYGARKAAVHSPSATRPGKISDDLRAEFEALGQDLCTASPASGLIEVYPHAALIELLSAPERLKYKATKVRAYWPNLCEAERDRELRNVWAQIAETLDCSIAGVAAALPPPAQCKLPSWRLKAYEDKLDAVVCAAVAIAGLDRKAVAYGDDNAAIWVPIADAEEKG